MTQAELRRVLCVTSALHQQRAVPQHIRLKRYSAIISRRMRFICLPLPHPLLPNTYALHSFFLLLPPSPRGSKSKAPHQTRSHYSATRTELMAYSCTALLFNARNALLLGILYIAFQTFVLIFARYELCAEQRDGGRDILYVVLGSVCLFLFPPTTLFSFFRLERELKIRICKGEPSGSTVTWDLCAN